MSAAGHPTSERLAMYAGGDLGRIARWRAGRHCARCAACRAEVVSLRAALAGLKRGALALPAELNWDTLAAEMKANIHLGLQVGEIARGVPAEPARARKPRVWQTAAVAASLGMVLFTTWFFSAPRDFYRRLEPPVARATAEGIGVAHRGSALTVLTPGARDPATSAQVGAGVQTRYVDQESGQVTIAHVFAE